MTGLISESQGFLVGGLGEGGHLDGLIRPVPGPTPSWAGEEMWSCDWS